MAVKVQFTAIVPKRRRRGFTDTVRKDLNRYTEQFAQKLRTEMQQYPPAPSDRYIRTFVLQQGWKVGKAGTPPNIGRRVYNNVPYAAGVVGTSTDPGRQWWMHTRTGWQTLADTFERLGGRGKFRHDTQAIINHAVRDGGI